MIGLATFGGLEKDYVRVRITHVLSQGDCQADGMMLSRYSDAYDYFSKDSCCPLKRVAMIPVCRVSGKHKMHNLMIFCAYFSGHRCDWLPNKCCIADHSSEFFSCHY